MTNPIKVFQHLPELECFVVRKEFIQVVETLKLAEWTPVVWIGRLFMRDQDFGEHWFDNWDERESIAELAAEKGIDIDAETWDEEKIGDHGEFACVVIPDRFTAKHPTCIHCLNPPIFNDVEEYKKLPCPKCGNDIHVGADGPCYSDKIKKLFWTDVLKSLHVSLETMFELARDEHGDEIEVAIQVISNKYGV